MTKTKSQRERMKQQDDKIKKEVLKDGLKIIQKTFPNEKESYQQTFQYGENVFVDLAIQKTRDDGLSFQKRNLKERKVPSYLIGKCKNCGCYITEGVAHNSKTGKPLIYYHLQAYVYPNGENKIICVEKCIHNCKEPEPIEQARVEEQEGRGNQRGFSQAIREVRELIEKTIQKIGKQRDEDDYSTLDKGHPNCPEGCGDEGLYHQEQILKELLVEFDKKFGGVK